MNHYIRNPKDLNQERIQRDLDVMCSEITHMGVELKQLMAAVVERKNLRLANLADQGGVDALTPAEQEWQRKEDLRLDAIQKAAANAEWTLAQAWSTLQMLETEAYEISAGMVTSR